MRRIIFSLLLLYSSNIFAKGSDQIIETEFTPIQINEMFVEKMVLNKLDYQDYVVKEEKVDECVTAYIEKQEKSYTKIAQSNLYDLIHNFSSIVSRVYGKKPEKDDIPYDEKIEALARVQCEAYYAMGVLK